MPEPTLITPDQYDRLSTRLWAMEQRLKVSDQTVKDTVDIDKIYEKQISQNVEIHNLKKHNELLQIALETLTQLVINNLPPIPGNVTTLHVTEAKLKEIMNSGKYTKEKD